MEAILAVATVLVITALAASMVSVELGLSVDWRARADRWDRARRGVRGADRGDARLDGWFFRRYGGRVTQPEIKGAFTTLLMSTGLTFGTNSATYGFTAVLPTAIAQRFFAPYPAAVPDTAPRDAAVVRTESS